MGTGQLVPRGKTPQDHRYTAVVMPLSLAKNRFGFMWVEMGPRDWEIYVRIRNLVSSALLRTMLVQQKEQAQKEVERLLTEAHERAAELASRKRMGRKNCCRKCEIIFQRAVTSSGSGSVGKILAAAFVHLATVKKSHNRSWHNYRKLIKNDRCALFLEDVNGIPRLFAHPGFPERCAH